MSFETRRPLIEKIENLRGSKVICYVTSLRPGVPAMIADDAVREIIDHLQRLPQQPLEKLDIFLVSNGGDGVVPLKNPLISIFANEINKL